MRRRPGPATGRRGRLDGGCRRAGALPLVLAVLLAVCWQARHPCDASGFALREQSASALGNALAGAAAAAEDPSYMFFNPAALARQDATQALVVATYIRPETKFSVKAAGTASGIAIGGGNGGSDVGEDEFLPAFYAVADLSRQVEVVDNLRIGLAVTSPFGLETRYNDGWAGRYYALQSSLQTVNLSPTLAFDLIPGLSIGAGLQAQYMEAKLSNAIDFGSIGARVPSLSPFARPTGQDGKARFDGNDWGFGWTLGVLYEPWEGTRMGVGYRSQVDQELEGDARFRLDQAGIGQAISQATGAFRNTGARATLDTPETITFGGYQELDPQWSVMADAAWTRWSRIRELRIEFDNSAQPEEFTAADWRDSWWLAMGVTYRLVDPWSIRAGVAYDQTPIPNSRRTPRVPDNDRYWISLGATYRPSETIDVSFGYAHIFAPDASVDLSAGERGNLARGNLSGTVDASVDLFGLQARWTY